MYMKEMDKLAHDFSEANIYFEQLFYIFNTCINIFVLCLVRIY